MFDVTQRRLDLAGTRSFAAAGAGQARRAALAEFARSWLAQRWQEAAKGMPSQGLALAAVGSVARGDAGPLSDYDLVLLHDGRGLSQKDLDAFADRLWYPMWDSGTKIDHSVRTVAQCRQVAAADLTAAVGLLDLAHIAGDEQVVSAARSTVAHDWRGNARKRLPEMIDAVTTRHTRMGDCAHLLEPDLKEARGGLRDMTVLRALTAAWLADRPHGEVDAAYGRILDVRDAVHVVTGRARDRLTRDEHDSVAALLGHAETDRMLIDLSQAARVLAYAVDGTLRRAAQSQRARVLRVGPRRPSLEPLGYGLFRHDGEVVLGPGIDPRQDPTLALRAAGVAARAGMPLAPATLANLASTAAALPDTWPADALALFTELLAAGPGLVAVWEGLDLAGIIETWIPQWRDVRSRPQHNAVHRHTVDRHSIEAVVVAGGLVRDVQRPDLLLLAALLHDIGKVAGAVDHAEVGAPVADAILRRLGVPDDDRGVVVRLVREHLTLVELATRRDPHDPATIASLTNAVDGSLETLALLGALTEADASAAGPAAWTDWRAQLVARLTAVGQKTLQAASPLPTVEPPRPSPAEVAEVRAGRPVVRVERLGTAYRLHVLEADRTGLFADLAGLFAASGVTVRSAQLRTVDGLAVDEWVVESPLGETPDPAALSRGLARLSAGDRTPLTQVTRRRHAAQHSTGGPRPTMTGRPGISRAMVVPEASRQATVIEVRATDRKGLLHDLGTAVTSAGLSVRSAHIATYAGQALDTFYLTRADGTPLSPAEVGRTIAALIDAADGR